MPVWLFWILIATVVASGFYISISNNHSGPFILGLVIAGFAISIHYLSSSPPLAVDAGQVLANQQEIQKGVDMTNAFAFLAVSGFWFWAIVAVALVSGFICWINDKENVAFSVLVFAGLVLATMTLGIQGFADFLWDHVWTVALYACLFVFVGAPLVALLRWHLLGIDKGEDHLEEVRRFLQNYGPLERMDARNKETYEKRLRYEEPNYLDYKAEILGWMMYWPLYLADTLIREFLWKVFKRIYQLLAPVFQRIAKYNAKRVQHELDRLAKPNGDTRI